MLFCLAGYDFSCRNEGQITAQRKHLCYGTTKTGRGILLNPQVTVEQFVETRYCKRKRTMLRKEEVKEGDEGE